MSQRDVILRALKDAGPDRGVHGFEWEAQGILRYAARIHELKQQGYTITSTHEALTPGGAIGARYRLMADPVVPVVPLTPVPNTRTADRLFASPSHYGQEVA